MGEYVLICNLDKKEFLSPKPFGHLHKIGDMVRATHGAMTGLSFLLVSLGNGPPEGIRLLGRWAGDRVAIVGDYYEGNMGGTAFDQDAWYRIDEQQDGWVDISEHVIGDMERFFEIHVEVPVEDMEQRSIMHPDGTITSIPLRK